MNRRLRIYYFKNLLFSEFIILSFVYSSWHYFAIYIWTLFEFCQIMIWKSGPKNMLLIYTVCEKGFFQFSHAYGYRMDNVRDRVLRKYCRENLLVLHCELVNFLKIFPIHPLYASRASKQICFQYSKPVLGIYLDGK